MKDTLVEFELLLIEELMGQIDLLQTHDEKIDLVELAIERILKKGSFDQIRTLLTNEEEKVTFVNNFLSYGIVAELLADLNVEDIIINNLKPIYIHHSQKGFIATDKHFVSKRELDLFVRKLLLLSGRKKMGKIMNLELPNLEGR